MTENVRAVTKTQMVEAIAELIGVVPAPAMSTGSTEPKEIFIRVNEELGLGIDSSVHKPDVARENV